MTNNLQLQLLQAKQRRRLQTSLDTMRQAVQEAASNYRNFHLLRQKAKNWRWESIENLDRYLQEFETNFQSSGGEIIWAETAEEARNEIRRLRSEQEYDSVVIGRSSEAAEIELETFFQNVALDYQLADFGQHISKEIALSRRHSVYPLIEMETQEVAQKMQLPGLNAEKMSKELRKVIRKKQKGLTLSITGADFLLADSGWIANCSTEGDASWASAVSDTQIVVAGIDRVLPNLNALHDIMPVHASFQNGQRLPVRTLLQKGNKPTDGSAPRGKQQRKIVIIIDNGRSDLLADPIFREALYDLEGSSFVLDCPVYQHVSGAHYYSLLPGPLGSVLTHLLYKERDFEQLPFLSSFQDNLCSNPYLINLNRMIVNARSHSINGSGRSTLENYFWKGWKKAMLSRKELDKRGSVMKNTIYRKLFGRFIGGKQSTPAFAKKSFAQLWEERR